MAVNIKRGSALDQLPLTPLIDVVFNLLIFFLVATRFAEVERELPVALPQASEARPISARPSELFINIDAAGTYFVTGQIVSLAELDAKLHQARARRPEHHGDYPRRPPLPMGSRGRGHQCLLEGQDPQLQHHHARHARRRIVRKGTAHG